MTESRNHWTRKCSTARLNALLADGERLVREGKPVPSDTLRDVLAEKDRRLADPNSPDFRPQFN